MKLPKLTPAAIVPQFDEFLAKRGVEFEAVIIGAGALHLMKIISRLTIDLDILTPKLSGEVLQAAKEFRDEMKLRGIDLIEGWINNGPASLLKDLPKDWEQGTQTIFKGKVLTLKTLSRADLIKSKLYAYCDRDERDFEDLKALNPKHSELLEALPWVKDRDGNPGWPNHVEQKVTLLAKALGYEL